ncbi:transcriptional regulator, LuxR family [Beutenbergia cavernae DSM 12333]|uniref:Transcriptional regulator, LuxR family n=1 Tax=Beutenbergia cavernae (strain ATCC BAA-8 / DSM 12333 / CCUG 43141 / JCM 11478 / NBRC 16432 / NCIMB 13614 / HKI 0122) TaxID=471853 RepID=C5BWG9_BEUC1|nr:LuxR C-terminal-related transcriptional regulator [Beutenbergia cavernae]ACQ78627.1 transcriptional regulator, LuxR family [Beutenbergia cavernae DSM 12333]
MHICVIGVSPLVRHGLALQLRARGIAVHAELASAHELDVRARFDAALVVASAQELPALPAALSGLLDGGTAVLVLTDSPGGWVTTAGRAGSALRSVRPVGRAPRLARAVARRGRLDVMALDDALDTDVLLGWLSSATARGEGPRRVASAVVVGRPTPFPPPGPRVRRALTAAESAVLALVGQGYSNAGIASALSLSPKTVECYVSAVFGKLGLFAEDRERNRRVAAALEWLQSTG